MSSAENSTYFINLDTGRMTFLPWAACLALLGPAAPDSRPVRIYYYTEKEHKLRLVVPEGLAVVRGILVVGPYSGGDSRDYHQQAWYREFLHLHGFAFLGAKDFYLHDVKVLQNAL